MSLKEHKFRLEDMIKVNPLTDKQSDTFQAWERGEDLVLNGSAGTGKTFMAMTLALEEALDKETFCDKVMIVRSTVPTRNQGFMPGTKEEKESVFLNPYRSMCSDLFKNPGAYDKLVSEKKIDFESTSYLRGETWNDTIVIVDEMQNLSFHELDTAYTRLGTNSRIIFAGDYYQSDMGRGEDKQGILKFLKILERLTRYTTIQFEWSDIVRCDKVRDYIMTKEQMEKNGEI